MPLACVMPQHLSPTPFSQAALMLSLLQRGLEEVQEV